MSQWHDFWHATGAVAWKDLLSEARSRELLSSMLVFAALVLFIFNFAMQMEPKILREAASGVIWVTLAFAGTLGLNRSMAVEKDNACLDGLLLAPVDRAAIYFGKAISNLIFMLLVAAIVLPLYAVLYNNMRVFRPGFLLVILLGVVGYVAVGTLLAAMSVQARTRDILLPVLLFPLVLPVLIAAVQASNHLLQDAPLWDAARTWLNVLMVYDVVFTAIAFMVFDYIVEE